MPNTGGTETAGSTRQSGSDGDLDEAAAVAESSTVLVDVGIDDTVHDAEAVAACVDVPVVEVAVELAVADDVDPLVLDCVSVLAKVDGAVAPDEIDAGKVAAAIEQGWCNS